jgi:hypothetical protein
MSRMKVRELLYWDILGAYILQYDFSFRDPASGHWRQYGTRGFWDTVPPPDMLADAREFNKRTIAREIDRLCGDKVQPMQMHLPTLPVSARFV